jgi:hypothetical protein
MNIDWGFVAGLGVGLLGVAYTALPYYQSQLNDDPEYRREVAERLAGADVGERYRGSLSRALDWLDKVFGPPGSAQALGVCILVAVAYAYASYYIGWGLGGPGNIGGLKELLPDEMPQPGRAIIALVSVLLPPLVFYTGLWVARWANRKERRLKANLLRRMRRRIRRRSFALAYRLILGLMVFLLLLPLAQSPGFGDGFLMFIFFVSLPLVGARVSHRLTLPIPSSILATLLENKGHPRSG